MFSHCYVRKEAAKVFAGVAASVAVLRLLF
jgi:hypothetical protein